MRLPVSSKIRKAVEQRANYKCEYCCIHQDDMFLSFELDHVIPLKHRGTNDFENLALACPHCNQHKGSDFATLSGEEIVRLFNPRTDRWSDHFVGINGEIVSKSKIGEASVRVFRFNEPDLIILRQALIELGHYSEL
jgi:HNH endonuclease